MKFPSTKSLEVKENQKSSFWKMCYNQKHMKEFKFLQEVISHLTGIQEA